jgi:hypothetical protein
MLHATEPVHSTSRPARGPHPFVYTLLYLPFGAMSGFVTVALTFLASASGISVAETSLLGGANLLSAWLKWTWAPIVDVTLSPKRWYVISTTVTSLGVFAMSAIPMTQATLPLLLGVIALTSLINSIVGMSIEAIIAAGYPRDAVLKVVRLMRISEYKRRQSPVGIRVTHRAFGRDWRYPITSRFRD